LTPKTIHLCWIESVLIFKSLSSRVKSRREIRFFYKVDFLTCRTFWLS
jgi:hypothetical protein